MGSDFTANIQGNFLHILDIMTRGKNIAISSILQL